MNEQMTAEISNPPLALSVDESCYYSIAMPLLEKRVHSLPVKPEPEKCGEYGWNNLAYYADEIVHRCLARKFPNHNAAVISQAWHRKSYVSRH